MERGVDRHILSYLGDIDLVSIKQYDYAPSITQRQVTAFISKLDSYGLYEHEVLVLLDRFVFNKTFSEITEECGYLDARTTHKVYKQALAKCEKAYTYLKEGKN